jgi:hypothetical protein
MTTPDLTPDEAEIVAAFDAAEYPAEVAQAARSSNWTGNGRGMPFVSHRRMGSRVRRAAEDREWAATKRRGTGFTSVAGRRDRRRHTGPRRTAGP